ncbi:MAG: hypothetical protein ACKVQU_19875 [Burkholderiales bacterium]
MRMLKWCVQAEQRFLLRSRSQIASTDQIVLEALVEMRQVDLVIEQVVQRMVDRAGQRLPPGSDIGVGAR